MKYRLLVLIMCVAVMGLAGCSDQRKPGSSSDGPRKVTLHEPGVYKGANDSVLAEQKKQELIDRLKLVQTDR